MARRLPAFLFTFSTLLITSTRSAPSYPTIKELNTEQYLGRWYNMYTNANTLGGTFEIGTKCVTGDYGKVDNRNDAITVYNAGQVKLIGTKFSTNGFGTQSPDASEPGKFLVKQGSPFGGGSAPTDPPVYTTPNYIIMELGPVIDGKYDYTLITGGKLDLFVMARDKNRFAEKYQKDVLEKLASWGFTGKAEPAATVQDGCTYQALPPELVDDNAGAAPSTGASGKATNEAKTAAISMAARIHPFGMTAVIFLWCLLGRFSSHL